MFKNIRKKLKNFFTSDEPDLSAEKKLFCNRGAQTSDQIMIMSVPEEVIRRITFGGGKP